jgi:hypothetical protein
MNCIALLTALSRVRHFAVANERQRRIWPERQLWALRPVAPLHDRQRTSCGERLLLAALPELRRDRMGRLSVPYVAESESRAGFPLTG